MRSDVHHVIPTDGYVNNRRGSYPFGEVSPSNYDWKSQNNSRLGPNTFGSYSGIVFEPIDEFKGDIARALYTLLYDMKIKLHPGSIQCLMEPVTRYSQIGF